MTEEDKDLERIDHVASLLRARPLLPPLPTDATQDWLDVDSGVSFPRAHCAFSGCGWVSDDPGVWEANLARHVERNHKGDMQLGENNESEFYAYYCAAIAEKERLGKIEFFSGFVCSLFLVLSGVKLPEYGELSEAE